MSVNTSPRMSWGTRLGFYFTAVGSAFGLGNLWRFPYVVAENGGGAFVLVYILFAFVIGLPLLVGELILGKSSRKSAIVAMGASRRWRAVAAFAVFVTVLVLSYYAVISGWVLHYVMQMLVSFVQEVPMDPQHILVSLRDNGWLQVLLASVHVAVLMFATLKGVEQGIEKWVGFIMPLFGIMLVALIVQTLSLPTAIPALKFIFYPDFSKLTWSAPIQAVGHTLFTLSVGFGTMVTFGSYLRSQDHVPGAAYRVTLLDTLISLFAGLLIFPIVLASDESVRGPEVLFQTVPRLFTVMENGFIFGLAFFICLYLAALTASLGLFESVVANITDLLQLRRRTATCMVALCILLMSLLPALSTSALRSLSFKGRTVLEMLDAGIINFLLPLSALGICFFVVYKLKPEKKVEEFEVSHPSARLFSNWYFMMKWGAPTVIILALLLEFTGLFVVLF